MWLGNQYFLVVSDPQIVKDLVITNGSVFSSRKEMFMKSQIIFARRGITATPYDDTWYDTYHSALSEPNLTVSPTTGGSTVVSQLSS